MIFCRDSTTAGDGCQSNNKTLPPAHQRPAEGSRNFPASSFQPYRPTASHSQYGVLTCTLSRGVSPPARPTAARR